MDAYYDRHGITVYEGDCIEVMRTLADDSVDAVLTDPPYSLGFMGRKWDSFSSPLAFQEWCQDWATECLRVLKPGGYLAAFGGTRTYHRLAAGIEDAGFEIRDTISWIYSQGMPKGRNVSKAIDARRDWAALYMLQGKIKAARESLGISQSEAARRAGLIGPNEALGGGGFMWFETGLRVPSRKQYPLLKEALGLDDECDLAFEAAEREVIGSRRTERVAGSWTEEVGHGMFSAGEHEVLDTLSATDEARRWEGWHTALKPAAEQIVVARKPLVGSVAQNVLTYGTGAMNVDAARVPMDDTDAAAFTAGAQSWRRNDDWNGNKAADIYGDFGMDGTTEAHPKGRWPTNVVFAHAAECTEDDCVPGCQVAELDAQSGIGKPKAERVGPVGGCQDNGTFHLSSPETIGRWPADLGGGASRFFPAFRYHPKAKTSERPTIGASMHTTVKPAGLMAWLIELFTQPGGVVLDPFAGSGSTGKAARQLGFRCLLIEKDAAHLPLIVARLDGTGQESPRLSARRLKRHGPSLFDDDDADDGEPDDDAQLSLFEEEAEQA